MYIRSSIDVIEWIMGVYRISTYENGSKMFIIWFCIFSVYQKDSSVSIIH